MKVAVHTDRLAARRRRNRREVLLLSTCIGLLLLATIPPLVNLGRYQHRITGAISRSIGRPITTGQISFRLLPWPAFTINNLTVAEDPAFGAEPALRAPEVIAEPSLRSLWRGRFELSRIELTDASVNLVRNPDGRWSVSSVLLQASHIANAPTGQPHAGPVPRFPYIEATGTRINLKRGSEKLPYSLLNADFSMWLDRPEVWQIRLEGQPVRTDLALSMSDTGLLRLDGELHRASALGAMPIRMEGEWNHAPLGQLSRLLLGRDAGWRGDIDLTAQFAGEMDRLEVRTHLSVANLHRQEFTPEQPFVLDASCQGHYSRANPLASALACRWPVGSGALLLRRRADAAAGDSEKKASQVGDAEPSVVGNAGAWVLTADRLPVSFLVRAAGLAYEAVPAPERFAGVVDGSLRYRTQTLEGAWTAPSVSVDGAGQNGGPLVFTGLRLEAPSDGDLAPKNPDRPIVSHQSLQAQPMLILSSDPVVLGDPGAPLQLAAELTPQQYQVQLIGGASLPALQQAAASLGLPSLAQLAAPVADRARVQLALSSQAAWASPGLGGVGGPESRPDVEPAEGFPQAPPFGGLAANATGTLHLANVRWQPPWLPVPLELSSADATLAAGVLRWGSVAGALRLPGASDSEPLRPRLRFTASAQAPLHCNLQAACVTHFTLNLPTLDAETLQEALRGGRGELLSSLINRFDELDPRRTRLPSLVGSVQVGLLTLGRLPIRNVAATLATGNAVEAKATGAGMVVLRSLDGQALGGLLHLEGTIGLDGGVPRYALEVSLAGANAEEAAALWQEDWGPGTLSATAILRLQGTTASELLSSSRGSFHASWLRGSLPPALAHFASWSGEGVLDGAGLQLKESTLGGTAETVTGTIGWDRGLALALTKAPQAKPIAVAGTLAAPVSTGQATSADEATGDAP